VAHTPWEYDVILMGATPTTWTYKRDARISLPLEEILWAREGAPGTPTSELAPDGSEHRAPGPPVALAPLGGRRLDTGASRTAAAGAFSLACGD